MNRIGTDAFAPSLLAGRRWIDVRAPIEFLEGSIPGATNLPLLDDEERRLVGIEYKKKGQEAAIALGHRLVSGEKKENRIRAWIEAAAKHPECAIYCFRGGLRSGTVQAWLQERGITVPVVEGGYKALRRFLVESSAARAKSLRFEVVCGPTGSGKTPYLQASGRPYLDLEGLARHRGSAFGALETSQPSQIDFENAIALELLRCPADAGPILIEDESRMIGRLTVPAPLFEIIRSSPTVELDVPIEVRVENIFRDYVSDSKLGKRGDLSRFDEFRSAVRAISRRLGDERARAVIAELDACEAQFRATGALDANRGWIRKLLEWYYDPVYRRSRETARESASPSHENGSSR